MILNSHKNYLRNIAKYKNEEYSKKIYSTCEHFYGKLLKTFFQIPCTRVITEKSTVGRNGYINLQMYSIFKF